ncbi:MAG: acyl-CoA thioester hydrolase [Myxococcota bacterium]|jgi:acyl-CoA thioester hydrolase
MGSSHIHPVSVYYEDTDFSGLVYHANYLKYFERAREHLLGRDELVRLWRDEGLGFVVYRADLQFREGARFGDELEIRTATSLKSDYRAVFDQSAWKHGGKRAMVQAEIHLVCVDRANQLVRLPAQVMEHAQRAMEDG